MLTFPCLLAHVFSRPCCHRRTFGHRAAKVRRFLPSRVAILVPDHADCFKEM